MLTIEREKMILELLKSKNIVKTSEIIKKLGVSEATARRDLDLLEKKNLIKRVFGGAILNDNKNFSNDLDIKTRKTINKEEKTKIAKFAASLIEDSDCIYLDAGTTTLEMIKFIKAKDVKIVTNGLNLIDELERYSFTFYLVGGKIKTKTSCTIGHSAKEFLKLFNFNKVFLGANGFDTNAFSTPDPDEALVKETALLQGEKVYFLCDSSKADSHSLINFATFSQGTLITDKKLPKIYKNYIIAEEKK